MDSESGSQIPSASNTSAIPRFSKLPMPRSTATSTKAASQIPAPPSQRTVAPASVVTSKSSVAKSSSGTAAAVPRLQKRASVASFSSTTSASSKDTGSAVKPPTIRSNLPNRAPRSLAKPSITTRASSARPATVATQQRRTLTAPAPTVGNKSGQSNNESEPLDTPESTLQQTRKESIALDSDEVSSDAAPRSRKGPRPSLSDRTIESLQATPKNRRKSSFFRPSESPMAPPSRPSSSLSRNGRNSSRPGTSDGASAQASLRMASPPRRAPATTKPARVSSGGFGLSSSTVGRRSTSAAFVSKLKMASKQASQPEETSPTEVTAPVEIENRKARAPKGPLTKVAIDKPTKPRPSQATAPQLGRTESPAESSSAVEPKRIVSSSSTALRQQIAAAKAAARKERTKVDSPQNVSVLPPDRFDLDLHADPFNQAPRDEKHVLRNRINTARMEGKLNIAAMNLKQIPEEVLQMYSASSMEESNVNWAEVVDLTRFIAAENELEVLGDNVFPDWAAEDIAGDDQAEGNQFGGLEMLDLHGNVLQSIPLGFRRLERLTVLNLSHNKLENSALDTIAQIKSLKDLRLGNNILSGTLPASVCELPHLETLDLQANRLLGLPEALRDLMNLKVLNISGNQLTALPMESLQQIPLVELDASSNALIASLFPVGGEGGHSTLQHLNVANNSLAALTFTPTLDLRQLRSLNVTNNHLTVLPSVAGWSEIVTLQAGDNKVSDFPFGFTSLPKLRNANFTSNEIRMLDPEISRMVSLDSLILASNPLREKKFLTMSTTNMKRDLRGRIAPPEPEDGVSINSSANSSPVTVIGVAEPEEGAWAMRGNGSLDLSSTELSDDDNDRLGTFLQSNDVKQMVLRQTKITCIPPALWLGQDLRILDLSDNAMSIDYFSDELHLPSLQELNLSRCRLSSFEPLMSNLQASRLHSLNLSTNRLAGALPAFRNNFPLLTMLLASDNRFTSISAEALLGLQTVNLASNDIAQLPAEVGLLWDEGLRILEIGSNAFRVPNYRILEKGTEATLRWLRDKLPAGRAHGNE